MNNKPDFIDPLVVNHPLTQKLHKQPYQICTETVMDTSDPLIEFDSEGVCNHVKKYRIWEETQKLTGKVAENKLTQIVDQLRKEGKGKEYDCIMGLSGGVDSSYMAYFVTKVLGLRALVVHVDTGWNSELAIMNIQNVVQRLGLDLHTIVINWEEMRDLQLAYFKSGVANLDVPQDHTFLASLLKEAKKFGIKSIMNGGNMATESILPTSWGYDASDSTNLKAIHRKFGKFKLRTYPMINWFEKTISYPYVYKIKVIRPLEYIEYNKNEVKDFLMKELGWRDYGGKHYESVFTKFFQAHYLPTKFGFDKRKAHLSSLIVSGQLSREEAMAELQHPLYDATELEADKEYFCKKLQISREEFDKILRDTPSDYSLFANQTGLNQNYLRGIKWLVKFKKLRFF
jgi:N-acetyl sugar amidotransferase